MNPLTASEFRVSFPLSNKHLQTIAPNKFRKTTKYQYLRERFEFSDGDFVDLDWVKNNQTKVCLLLHGLEGSSKSSYIYGMIQNLVPLGYDCVVMNHRGCSGEPNRAYGSYHSGYTQDTLTVLKFLQNQYNEINLIGYSLGGNVALKLAGEQGSDLKQIVHRLVGVSVPCDLASTALQLQSWGNKIYHNRFLNSLKNKLRAKLATYPSYLSMHKVDQIKTLTDFDQFYTAPAFGFKDAAAYYHASSSKPYIPHIKVPTLLVTAQDDPFLSPASMPNAQVNQNDQVTFLNPKHGGHVGFWNDLNARRYWHEEMILKFLQE